MNLLKRVIVKIFILFNLDIYNIARYFGDWASTNPCNIHYILTTLNLFQFWVCSYLVTSLWTIDAYFLRRTTPQCISLTWGSSSKWKDNEYTGERFIFNTFGYNAFLEVIRHSFSGFFLKRGSKGWCLPLQTPYRKVFKGQLNHR